jgi:TP901 family phage tail tape measure protein
MRRAGRGFSGLADQAVSSRNRLRQFGDTLGKITSAGVVVGAGIGFSIKAFADFDDAAAALKARLIDTPSAFIPLKKQANELGESTKFTGAQVLGAMEGLTRFGLTAQQTTKAIVPVVKLAAIENISLAKAAEAVAASQKALGGETSFKRTLNLLTFTSGNTAATVGRLVEGLKLAGPALQLMQIPARQAVGILGIFNDNALFGSRAGTAFAAATAQIAKHQKDGIIKFGEYRIQIEKTAKGGVDMEQTFLNVATSLKHLQDKGKNVIAQKLADKVFGKRGSRAAVAFLKFVKGIDKAKLDKVFGTTNKKVNEFTNRVFKLRQQSVTQDFIKLSSAVDSFQRSLIETFKPQITSFIQGFTKRMADAAKVVRFFMKDPKRLEFSVKTIQKLLKGKVDPKTIQFVKDLVVGVRTAWKILKAIGAVFSWIGEKLTNIANAFGISRSLLVKIMAGILVVSLVIAAIVLAVKGIIFLFGVALAGALKFIIALFVKLVVKFGVVKLALAAWALSFKTISDFVGGLLRKLGKVLGISRLINAVFGEKKSTEKVGGKSLAVARTAALINTQDLVGQKTVLEGGKTTAVTKGLALKRAQENLAKQGITGHAQEKFLATDEKFLALMAKLPAQISESTRAANPKLFVVIDGKVVKASVDTRSIIAGQRVGISPEGKRRLGLVGGLRGG